MPELNGGTPMKMLARREIKLRSGLSQDYDFLTEWGDYIATSLYSDGETSDGKGIDMYSTVATPPIGPGYLPVLEYCELLITSSDKSKTELGAIADGTYSDKYEAGRSIMEYLHGNRQSDLARRKTIVSTVHSVQNDLEEIESEFFIGNEIVLQENAPAFLACIIQPRGLPPQVALSRASTEVSGRFSNIRQR